MAPAPGLLRRLIIPEHGGNVLAALDGLLRLAGGCLERRGDGGNPYFAIEPRKKIPGPVGGGAFLRGILTGGHVHKSKL